MTRWLKFNAVGAAGVVVQLAALAIFDRLLGLGYLVATGLAVEAAVLHNFFWHRRWTWADRSANRGVEQKAAQRLNPARSPGAALVRFHLTNGVLSIAGNLLLMHLFAGLWRVPPVAANLASIAVCSLATFVLSDRLVFTSTGSAARR